MAQSEQAPAPLRGIRVLEVSSGVAAAYAGRLLTVLGARTRLVEPDGGTPLRREPPFVADDMGALFAFLAAGKTSVALNLETRAGQARFDAELADADILIEDLPVADKARLDLDPVEIAVRHPGLVHVSVLPFGDIGPKAGWKGEEINLLHASGEGFLLPNGLTMEIFPDRPPLKIHGYFASMQGGAVAALTALMAVWARPEQGGQHVDVSVQDAAVAVGAFAVQRLGDGSLEHRKERSFRFGGVIACADGYIELLTLEDRQWAALVELVGRPDWATDERFHDPIERSRQGAKINACLREWAATRTTEDIAHNAQALGIPVAKYRSPAEVLAGEHERCRGLFAATDIPGAGRLDMLVSPYQFDGQALPAPGAVPQLPRAGEDYDRQSTGGSV